MKKTLIKIFTYSYLYIYRDESEQGFLTTINSNCISLNGAITARIFQIISSLARREHSKGWLRNREFGPKSNRHDTPPTFPIDLRPEVLPPSSSTLSLPLSNPREKENQAFVRTFLGHHQPPYQPFTLRSPSLSVTSRLPLRGKTEEPMKRPPRAWDTYATRRSRSAHVPPRESDISVWFRWREFFFFSWEMILVGWGRNSRFVTIIEYSEEQT